jgi:hypothetical protein
MKPLRMVCFLIKWQKARPDPLSYEEVIKKENLRGL